MRQIVNPVKHHPLVKQVLDKDLVGSITCSSKDEQDRIFNEICRTYGSRVTTRHHREVTAIYWFMKGRRSAAAKAANVTHHVIEVVKTQTFNGNEDVFKIRMKACGCWREAEALTKDCL